jgi:hypothetical protein
MLATGLKAQDSYPCIKTSAFQYNGVHNVVNSEEGATPVTQIVIQLRGDQRNLEVIRSEVLERLPEQSLETAELAQARSRLTDRRPQRQFDINFYEMTLRISEHMIAAEALRQFHLWLQSRSKQLDIQVIRDPNHSSPLREVNETTQTEPLE